MQTIQELAGEYADWFETVKRDNGTDYIRLRTEDKNIINLIRAAHNDMLPNDYKYQFIHEALAAISESTDIDDISLEPDCYNSDLLKWLSSNLTRAYYFDAVVNNYGYESFYNTLMLAQAEEKQEVFISVLNSLQKIIEE